jgi:single-strand DNA-binding protein
MSQGGTTICKFSLADTKGKKGEDQRTSWYDIVTFGALADKVADTVRKGDRLMILGQLQVEDYTNKSGEKKKRVEIVANYIGDALSNFTSSEAPAPAAEDDEEDF